MTARLPLGLLPAPVLAAVLAAVVIGGCAGDDGSDSDVGNRAVNNALAGNAPPCSLIWVEGKRLPLDYRGCEEEGSLESAAPYACLDGGRLAVYKERFYGRLGERVIAVRGDISEDEAYAEFFHDCVG